MCLSLADFADLRVDALEVRELALGPGLLLLPVEGHQCLVLAEFHCVYVGIGSDIDVIYGD